MAARGVNKLIDLYASGMSIPQVSDETGVSRSTVRYHVLRAGVLRSRGDGVRLAASDGRMSQNKGVKREFTPKWRQNISAGKKAAADKIARGVSKKPTGYLEITRGEHKGRGEHCVIAEEMIGRALRKDECVHHIDHDRSNNDPSNLQVMTRSEHAALHASENNHNRKRDSAGRYI